MSLVVPILRLAYTFFNVFETYKILKLPPPSSRNNGQPSVRAMTARKRAMKGCMTIWLVWCCFAMYERTLDGIVCLFIPFYNQFKTLVMLFFIVTRARGSEPIYLHVLRPCLKPYAATLDVVMDLTHNIGDFILLLLSIPVQYILEQYELLASRWTKRGKPSRAEVQSSVRSQSAETMRRTPVHSRASFSGQRAPSIREASRDARPGLRERTSSRSSRSIMVPSRRPIATRVPSSGSSGLQGRRTASSESRRNQTPQRVPVFEVWHPPASSRNEDVIDLPSGLPTPPADQPVSLPAMPPPLEETTTVDEWRQYPPFPSAYPPTPLPVTSRLSSDGPKLATIPAAPASFDGIPEEAVVAEPPNDQERELSETIVSHPESKPSDSNDELSDEQESMEGIEENPLYSSDDMDGDDEDEFNITLRTPKAQRSEQKRSPRKSLRPATSGESLASRSTGLDTADDGSTLRTRSSGEETSATLSVSDASSITGRKRRLPRTVVSNTLRARVEARSRNTRPSVTRNASTLRVRGKFVTQDTPASETADDESAPDVNDDELGVKRRRVPKAAAGFVSRPRQDDSDRTLRGLPAKFEVERRPRLHQPAIPKSRSESRVPLRAPLATRAAKTNVAKARLMPRTQSTSSVLANKRKTAASSTDKTE